MTEPLGADTADERPAVPAQTGPDPAPAPVAEDASAVVGDSAQDTPPAPRRRLIKIMWMVAAVAIIAGLTVAAVGFGVSYGTLVDAARRWGFGPQARYAVPVGIDGLIIALYSIALVLVWRRMPKPSLLLAAHAITAVTVVLNVTAAAESAPGSPGVWEVAQTDPGRLLAHAVMPVAYVLLVEAARHLITRTARLDENRGTLTLSDWLLDVRGTWRVWRRAKLWGLDYATVRSQERDRAIYGVWLQYREEISAARAQHKQQGGSDEDFDENSVVTVLDRLPDLLAPYGVTVAEALALPDQMRRQEQERRHEAQRRRQALEREAAEEQRLQAHEDRLASLRARREELREQSEVDVLEAEAAGERRAAQARAEGTAATAAIEASARQSAAERAATEAERRAEMEEQAQETTRTAALRRKAADDQAAALRQEEANVRQAEEQARRKEEAAGRAARAAKAEAQAEQQLYDAEQKRVRTAQLALQTAEARRRAGLVELAAVAAEDAAGLNERERNVRRVARLILVEAGGDALRLPLARIEEMLRVANGTASGYRSAAAELIASGYDHRHDPLHQIAAAH
ncbi:DUF2637 domain-containing protein [Streptomyces gilvosporeus]|uniref:DUF2637 domain-containing protein n=1 Tax=Streptomyces gilvosporeus TaxID=553510 RepID=UPI0033EA4823